MGKDRLVGIATLLSLFLLLCSTVADAHWRIHDYEKKLGLIRLNRYQFLPPVAIRDLKGNPFSLYEFRGEVILLNFWSRLCVVCREELEVLQQIHEEFAEEGLRVVAISVDKGAEDHVAKLVKEKGLTFPVVIDDEGILTEEFQVWAVPVTFVISRAGIVLCKGFGKKEWMSETCCTYMRALVAGEY